MGPSSVYNVYVGKQKVTCSIICSFLEVGLTSSNHIDLEFTRFICFAVSSSNLIISNSSFELDLTVFEYHSKSYLISSNDTINICVSTSLEMKSTSLFNIKCKSSRLRGTFSIRSLAFKLICLSFLETTISNYVFIGF